MKEKNKECKHCINTTSNPAITISNNGLCNVCNHYFKNFDKNNLKKELVFLKSFISNKKYDAMVGISGGKDSTATLYEIKGLGFSPLAFTFDIGYTVPSIFKKGRAVAKKIGVDYEIINIKKYISKTTQKSFEKMADLYEKAKNNDSEKFKNLYRAGRKLYSVKKSLSFPFVRPCQICRKVVIPAYYYEALRHNVSLVIIGINEWAGLSNNSYSGIRKLQPIKNKPPVYIVHLPFLLQWKIKKTKSILKKINWKPPKNTNFVDTGSGSCLLSRACEETSLKILGFHLDSSRLAREVTVGFISKKIAKKAIKKPRKTKKTVKQVLIESGIIDGK